MKTIDKIEALLQITRDLLAQGVQDFDATEKQEWLGTTALEHIDAALLNIRAAKEEE